MYRHSKSI